MLSCPVLLAACLFFKKYFLPAILPAWHPACPTPLSFPPCHNCQPTVCQAKSLICLPCLLLHQIMFPFASHACLSCFLIMSSSVYLSYQLYLVRSLLHACLHGSPSCLSVYPPLARLSVHLSVFLFYLFVMSAYPFFFLRSDNHWVSVSFAFFVASLLYFLVFSCLIRYFCTT